MNIYTMPNRFSTGPRFFLEHGALRRQLEEQEMILDMERKRLTELRLEKHRMQQFQLLADSNADQESYVDNYESQQDSSINDVDQVIASMQSALFDLHLQSPLDSNGITECDSTAREEEEEDHRPDVLPEGRLMRSYTLLILLDENDS